MKCPYCGKETDKAVCPRCYAQIAVEKEQKNGKAGLPENKDGGEK